MCTCSAHSETDPTFLNTILPDSDPRLDALTGLKRQSRRVRRMHGDGPPYIRLSESSRGRVFYRVRDVIAWVESMAHRSTSGEAFDAPAVGALLRGER